MIDPSQLPAKKPLLLATLTRWLKTKSILKKVNHLAEQVECYERLLQRQNKYLGKLISETENQLLKTCQDLLKQAEVAELAVDAKLQLGIFYLLGKGVAQDDKLAMHWFELAAKDGHLMAQLNLADMHTMRDLFMIDGDETESNLLANQYYEHAATQNVIDAQMALAKRYSTGEGIPHDMKKAFEWYQKAALLGNNEAQFHISQLYAAGFGVEKNLRLALEWNQKAADNGNSRAQISLAVAYIMGTGVAEVEKGRKWLDKALQQNNPTALYVEATNYEQGCYGVEKNKMKALELYEQAADLGSKAAQKMMFTFWRTTADLSKQKKAMTWLLELAKENDIEALFILGMMFEEGGRKKYFAEAMSLYEKAAEQDCVEAQVKLAEHYLAGVRITENPEEAIKWIRRAALLQDPSAQNYLGTFHYWGLHGFEKSDTKAYLWFIKAAEQNHPRAQIFLAEMIIKSTTASKEKKYLEAKKWLEMAVEQGDPEAQFLLSSLKAKIDEQDAKVGTKMGEKMGATLNAHPGPVLPDKKTSRVDIDCNAQSSQPLFYQHQVKFYITKEDHFELLSGKSKSARGNQKSSKTLA